MGNWDSFYYEVYNELQEKGMKQQFNELLNKLTHTPQYRHRSARDRWNVALQMLRNNEY